MIEFLRWIRAPPLKGAQLSFPTAWNDLVTEKKNDGAARRKRRAKCRTAIRWRGHIIGGSAAPGRISLNEACAHDNRCRIAGPQGLALRAGVRNITHSSGVRTHEAIIESSNSRKVMLGEKWVQWKRRKR